MVELKGESRFRFAPTTYNNVHRTRTSVSTRRTLLKSFVICQIEHLGTVASVDIDEGGAALTISQSGPILGDCHIGDSIAVNGACLTVTEFDKDKDGGWFKVWLANETLDRTDLGERVVGDQVNLERAMAAHTRFGGHFVQVCLGFFILKYWLGCYAEDGLGPC